MPARYWPGVCTQDILECPYPTGSAAAQAWHKEHDRYLAQRLGLPVPAYGWPV